MNHVLFLALGLGLPFLLKKSLKSPFALFFVVWAFVAMIDLTIFHPDYSIDGLSIASSLGATVIHVVVSFFAFLLITYRWGKNDGKNVEAEARSTKTPLTKKCPDCAEEIRFEAKVCRFCGKRFAIDEVVTKAEQANDTEVQSVTNVSESRGLRTLRCPKCGWMNYTDEFLCDECGGEL